MSLLYPERKDVKTLVDIEYVTAKSPEDVYRLQFDFSCDGGKHGTIEQLCSFEFTVDELMAALSAHDKLINK